MSEGIDFYDDQARAVIAFGIPYPPVNEPEIRLKREFNDEHQSEKVMSGREWYDAQALRSLFQATGRCIRHARDYGAVILIDQRFTEHLLKFPRWMKGRVQSDVPAGQIVEQLAQFYVEMKQRFPALEEQMEQQGHEIAFSQDELRQLATDFGRLAGEVSTLRSEVDDLKTQIAMGLRDPVTQLSTDFAELRTQLSNLKAQIASKGGLQSEEFSFHTEESAQHPGEAICVEGRKAGLGNPLSFRIRSTLCE
jgi:archaellum component FlaC